MYHGVGIWCGSPIIETQVFDLEDSAPEKAFIPLNNKKRGSCPKRSKLESYVDILIVLIQNGPLKLTHIKHETNFNSAFAKENLGFLVKLNLVEKIFERGETLFSITPRGIRVLRYFGEATDLLSVVQANK